MLPPDILVLSPDAGRTEQLIQQLGSEFYAERQAATMALSRAGEPALAALRRACENNEDAEIRRRAERLVNTISVRVIEERALAIRRSLLGREEKGQKLK